MTEDKLIHTGIISFNSRDYGWYEDDPDYYAEGSVGQAFVKISVPKLPGGISGTYKVTLILEESFEEKISACNECGHDCTYEYNGIHGYDF